MASEVAMLLRGFGWRGGGWCVDHVCPQPAERQNQVPEATQRTTLKLSPHRRHGGGPRRLRGEYEMMRVGAE